jgi:hypothetical protein
MTRESMERARRARSADPSAIPRLATLRVHGSAHGSAPLADTDDIVNRTGARYATPRRYEEPEDREDET